MLLATVSEPDGVSDSLPVADFDTEALGDKVRLSLALRETEGLALPDSEGVRLAVSEGLTLRLAEAETLGERDSLLLALPLLLADRDSVALAEKDGDTDGLAVSDLDTEDVSEGESIEVEGVADADSDGDTVTDGAGVFVGVLLLGCSRRPLDNEESPVPT